MDYVFLSLVVSTASGVILAIIAACIRSKCTTVKFCGVEVNRNVEIESHLEDHKLDLGIKDELELGKK
jgi:hypothetical protein